MRSPSRHGSHGILSEMYAPIDTRSPRSSSSRRPIRSSMYIELSRSGTVKFVSLPLPGSGYALNIDEFCGTTVCQQQHTVSRSNLAITNLLSERIFLRYCLFKEPSLFCQHTLTISRRNVFLDIYWSNRSWLRVSLKYCAGTRCDWA